MGHKTGMRADSTRYTRAEDDDPPLGTHNDGMTYVVSLDSGTWKVEIRRPTCPRCSSGEVKYDSRTEVVCETCGCVLSTDLEMKRDRVAAGQVTNNDRQ